MKRVILSIAAFLCLSVTAQAKTVYVDFDATGFNDGTSWSNAFNDLQMALPVATSTDEVWVAEGVYYPGIDPEEHFEFHAGYGIYGGFNGTETSLSERNALLNRTVLNGDIDENDIGDGDDALHIFYVEEDDDVDGAVLDGFEISDGFGDEGAGFNIEATNITVTIRNCIFTRNHDDDGGLGASICNNAQDANDLRVENCLFYDNKGELGAICNFGNITIANCTFYNNAGPTHSLYFGGGTAVVFNCIFWDVDKATYSGGGIREETPGIVTVTHSAVKGDWRGISGGEGCITNDPGFADAALGDFRLAFGSPCVDTGTSTNAPAMDLRGISRPQKLGFDMGALEQEDDTSPPLPITDFTTPSDADWIRLSWMNPTNLDFEGVLILRDEAATPVGVPSNAVAYSTNDFVDGYEVVYAGPSTNNVPGEPGGWIDTGLASGTNYFYRIFAYDWIPNYSIPVDATQIVADTTSPAPVDELGAVSAGRRADLRWINPGDSDFAGVVIVRKAGSYPEGAPAAGVTYTTSDSIGGDPVVYVGTGLSPLTNTLSGWSDSGLDVDTMYYYMVFASDEVPNYSAGMEVREVAASERVAYVDIDATGTNGGTSWADAYTNLQYALANVEEGNSLWVADGIYYPSDSGDITANFTLADNIGLYGGFNGTEGFLKERDVTNNVTILSGDLNTNGVSDVGDTVRGIVYGNDKEGIVVDGFTIQHNYQTTWNISGQMGGGVFLINCTAIIRNCIIRDNGAYRGGGAGAYGYNAKNSVIFANCLFYNNKADKGGALGIYHNASAGSKTYVVNCTFYNNICWSFGSIYISNGGYMDAHNSIFWDIGHDGGGINVKDDTTGCFASLKWSDINGGVHFSEGGQGQDINNINVDPQFASIVSNDFNLVEGSPCKDAGDPNSPDMVQEYDLNFNSRIYHVDPEAPDGVIDIGCFEWPPSRAPIIPHGCVILLYGNDDGAIF